MVKRVGGLRTRRLQIVPTHYWRDDGSAAGGVGSYCWMDGQYNCRSFTKARGQCYPARCAVPVLALGLCCLFCLFLAGRVGQAAC